MKPRTLYIYYAIKGFICLLVVSTTIDQNLSVGAQPNSIIEEHESVYDQRPNPYSLDQISDGVINHEMTKLTPNFAYNIMNGYESTKQREYQEPSFNSQYGAISNFYIPNGYNSETMTKMFENVNNLNPYLLQQSSPMTFMKADKIKNENINMNTTTIPQEQIPDEIKQRLESEYLNSAAYPFGKNQAFTYIKNQQGNKNALGEKAEILENYNDPRSSAANSMKFMETEAGNSQLQFPNFNYSDMGQLQNMGQTNNNFLKQQGKPCKYCPPSVQKSLEGGVKVPVYIPIPVFTYYQLPVLHHYPLNQIVRKVVPVPQEILVTHNVNKITPVPVRVEQKVLIPQAVPYGVKVPVPVPFPQKEEQPENTLKKEFEDLMKRSHDKPTLTKITNANILSIQEPVDGNTDKEIISKQGLSI